MEPDARVGRQEGVRETNPDATVFDLLASELGVESWRVRAAANLLDAGSTVPFIARYNKEATGTLDDAQLRDLEERLRYLEELQDRRLDCQPCTGSRG